MCRYTALDFVFTKSRVLIPNSWFCFYKFKRCVFHVAMSISSRKYFWNSAHEWFSQNQKFLQIEPSATFTLSEFPLSRIFLFHLFSSCDPLLTHLNCIGCMIGFIMDAPPSGNVRSARTDVSRVKPFSGHDRSAHMDPNATQALVMIIIVPLYTTSPEHSNYS